MDDLAKRQPFSIEGTPTRFGRVSLYAEPRGKNGWLVHFRREGNRAPAQVELPFLLGETSQWKSCEGAAFRVGSGGKVLPDPEASAWTACWVG
jgi:hypothetical protein